MPSLLQPTEMMTEYYTLSAAEKLIARTAVGIQILDAIPSLDYSTDVDATNFLGDGVARKGHTLSTANTAEIVFNANVSSTAVEKGLAELHLNANLSITMNTVGSASTAAYASVAINVRGDLLAMSAEDISASSGCRACDWYFYL